MYERACFRVSVDDVAVDFKSFAALARTRNFEIFDDGKVEVMLVCLDAVRDWRDTLQISIPTQLMTDDEIVCMRRGIEKLGDEEE